MIVKLTVPFLVTQKDGVFAIRKSSGELGWFLEGDYHEWTVQLHENLYLEFEKKESIFAIDPETGTIIWRSPGPGYIRSVTDDAVYLSAGTTLVALGKSDGKKRWKFKTGGFFRNGTSISAPPIRFGRQLIFPTATSLLMGQAPNKGRLYSIDAETGKLK